MARRARVEPTSVTMTYDLFDLPTAQHKAGLAGLLLQIESMANRKPNRPRPRVVAQSATQATIEFTKESVQELMDDLYDAEIVETRVRSRWNEAPLRVETTTEPDEDGSETTVRLYVYEVCQPKGYYLAQYLPARMDSSKDWLKLWRDMLWAIPRGNPQSRQPFEQRASRPPQPCKEGSESWKDLLKAESASQANRFQTAVVASSLWLGAQARNAEDLPFEGRLEQNLLLHFWPLVVLVYVPQAIEIDGTAEFSGYVLAIPEVANLDSFCRRHPRMLANLGTDIRGFRPAEAVIDLPAEGALSFFEHLARLASDKAGQSELATELGSIEYLHLIKRGNNIKTMAAGRVALRPYLLERYQAIVGPPGCKEEDRPYRNPLFRRGLMRALLDDLPWFRPLGDLLVEWPAPFFVNSDRSPRNLAWFWIDSRRMFNNLEKEHADAMRNDVKQVPEDDRLAILLSRVTRTYLSERAKQKSGIDPDNFREGDRIAWEKLPREFNDARRAIGESLFLEFRSRRNQAFIDHFAQTFFAVKQFMGEEQLTELSKALLTRPEDVKTLTLLALSANS